ncbi:hypothetical protein SK128_013121 [Halocaridina rubra]|uniref:Uncharacterized protein n=1 Tax=Halocaridina rubra TaxID=373956 RepID=A0AAN9A5S0_HALRR
MMLETGIFFLASVIITVETRHFVIKTKISNDFTWELPQAENDAYNNEVSPSHFQFRGPKSAGASYPKKNASGQHQTLAPEESSYKNIADDHSSIFSNRFPRQNRITRDKPRRCGRRSKYQGSRNLIRIPQGAPFEKEIDSISISTNQDLRTRFDGKLIYDDSRRWDKTSFKSYSDDNTETTSSTPWRSSYDVWKDDDSSAINSNSLPISIPLPYKTETLFEPIGTYAVDNWEYNSAPTIKNNLHPVETTSLHDSKTLAGSQGRYSDDNWIDNGQSRSYSKDNWAHDSSSAINSSITPAQKPLPHKSNKTVGSSESYSMDNWEFGSSSTYANSAPVNIQINNNNDKTQYDEMLYKQYT